MEKKKRATNLQMQEKELLVDLVVKYSDTIENKSTDVASVRTKTDAWKRLAEEFNGTTPSAIPREWQQLKHAYENIKCRSKKALANDRVQRLRTGGGSFISQVDPVEEKVATLLGNRARPLTNCYDSDATYCDDTVTYYSELPETIFTSADSDPSVWGFAVDSASTSLQPQSILSSQLCPAASVVACGVETMCSTAAVLVITTSAAATVTSSTAVVPSSSFTTAFSQLTSSAQLSLTTATAAAATSVPPSDVTATLLLLDPVPSTSHATAVPSATTQSHRQWSRSARTSRRPNAVDRRRSQSSATEEISSLAKLQSAYYKRKLEMKEEQHALYIKEHERKAKVYDLQEQYYAAKLRKLAEE